MKSGTLMRQVVDKLNDDFDFNRSEVVNGRTPHGNQG